MYIYRHIYTGTPLFNGKTADICIYSYMYIHICIYKFIQARPSSQLHMYKHVYILVCPSSTARLKMSASTCIYIYIYIQHTPLQWQDCRYTARKASCIKAGVEPVHQYRPRLTQNWFSGTNPKCRICSR